ncbi:MAG: SDR family oxidoreductase [Candidatus Methylopumilus sp.]|jgi:nucleoside-diphosphate-sugar epimerase
MTKVLVTGASGFVGRILCSELGRRGYKVRGAVRNLSRKSRLTCELVEIEDLNSLTDWSSILDGIDVVIHLAARVHLMHDDAVDPLAEFRKTNVEGTSKLAIAAATNGVKRLVFLSSIKVNGEQANESYPFTESDLPELLDPYAISKWEAEQVLRRVEHETGLEVVIIRPPLVYGAGVKANFLHLMKVVDGGVPLPMGAIDNHRSIIYVENLVDALITCARHHAAAGQTYLVSDGEPLSTPQLVRAMADALHRPSRIFSIPLRVMRVIAKLAGKSAVVDRLTQSLVVDSSKICNQLGWQPPFTTEQGLQATAVWYADLKIRP